MSKQARAMALLVIENAELRKERDALAAELRAGREGNQHYAGELRTFFEGVRALIGAEEMKDDCSSVLQELGRHTSDRLHPTARAVLDVIRAEYAGDPDKDPALRWLALGHKLYPWFEAGFPGTSSEGSAACPDDGGRTLTGIQVGDL